jgi:hypothetical protein
MIRVLSVDYLDEGKKQAKVFMEADTKAEVTDGAEFIGMPKGYTPAPFSRIFTASKELAIMQSDGTWVW